MAPRSRASFIITAALLIVCASPCQANAPTPLSVPKPQEITDAEGAASFYKQPLSITDILQEQNPNAKASITAASLVLVSQNPNYFTDLIHTEEYYRNAFVIWKREMGVSFAMQATDQELLRLVVFAHTLDELETITSIDDAKSFSFTVSPNAFAALTTRETTFLSSFTPLSRRRRLGSIKVASHAQMNEEEEINSDDVILHDIEPSQHVQVFRRQLADTPASIDWRERGVVTDVKSQGVCGGCWAFAATGALESTLAIDTTNLISLSERQLLDCDTEKNNECNGGNYYYSFYHVATNANALATSEDYPYSDTGKALTAEELAQGSQREKPECRSTSTTGVVRSSGVVYFVERSEQALMEAVAQAPVAVAISGYAKSFRFYNGGVYDSTDCGVNVDHAVLLVGYGTTPEGQDYWLVKNSWGTSWGDNGYGKLARNDPNINRVSKGLGTCGILFQPNFVSAAFCTVDDCDKYKSRQFCTVEKGCLNSTDEYSSVIPDRTFQRDIPENIYILGETDNIGLALSITVLVCVLILLAVYKVMYDRRNKKKKLEIKLGTHIVTGQVLFGVNTAHVKGGELDNKPALKQAVKMTTAQREKKYKELAEEFFVLVNGREVPRETVIMYLNGVDGDVKAAADLYLKKADEEQPRWI